MLEAFLCANDFDIVILGESQLTSNVDENDIKIDGYSFKRSDNPNDDARGGVTVYHKSSHPCIFKPDLTKLDETLVLPVKVGSKKCFLTCIYRNLTSLNNSKNNVEEFSNGHEKTLDNIKGKNSYTNIAISDMNAKNNAWWGEISDYPGEAISGITTLHGLHETINQTTHFYPGKRPSWIDLIFCSQPNLFSESRVLPSLLPQ